MVEPYSSVPKRSAIISSSVGGTEIGNGSPTDPYRQVLRDVPNSSDCFYCPSDTCDCEWFGSVLNETYNELPIRRITSVAGKRFMCAKSIEPNFVSRIVRLMNIDSSTTFYDLGSGNGSVLFQVAFSTGARCIGIELCPHNSELSRQAWDRLRPKLEKKSGRKMPELTIITGDLSDYISSPGFASDPTSAIWTSNLLMPKPVTAFMAERFRLLPSGVRIACFDDLYPHSRSVMRIRDPQAFEQFLMEDYEWPPGAVEWCPFTGAFFIHRKK